MMPSGDAARGKRPTGQPRAALATRLAALLEDGLPLEPECLECIAMATGEAEPGRAFALLAADPDCAEHAPLLALAFSPGEGVRQALESALAAAALDARGARALAGQLARQAGAGLAVRLLLPGGGRLAPLPPGEALAGLVGGFVRRLRPEATPPPELLRVLSGRPDAEGLADALAARLRHRRLAWSPARVFFMATLLERAQAGDDLPALTDWALGFLDLTGVDFEPRQALAERRAALEALLRQAEAQEQDRERGCFELRASLGRRHGHLHAPDLRAALALCLRAEALTVGRAAAQGNPVRLDLGHAEDAEALLRLLAGRRG